MPTWMPPVFAGIALFASVSACAGHSSRAASWHACPRPASAADIRRFRVAGGATCAEGQRVLGWTAFGHEGECGNACHYGAYTCAQRPGGLVQNGFGGSYYTYEDDSCIRGARRAMWRIVFH